MIELTIQIPDDLACQLQPVQNHLPEIIRIGLHKFVPTNNLLYTEVIEFLAGGPPPQSIINFRPSIQAQTRVNHLLLKNQTHGLSAEEQTELDYYEQLDYLMTLVKAKARQHLSVPL